MARKLSIAFGKRVRGTWALQQKQVSWDTVVTRLSESRKLDIDWGDLVELGKHKETSGRLLDYKQSPGWYMGSHFTRLERREEFIDKRTMFTADLDNVGDPFDVEMALADYDFVLHSTAQYHPDHQPGNVRIAGPISRPMEPAEYEPFMRMLFRDCVELLDPVSFRVNQVMFYPAHCQDVEPLLIHNEGEVVDVDAILAEYNDWRDHEEWPRAPGEDIAIHEFGKVVQWAPEIPGIIGAFCRAYTIQDAIVAYDLPYDPTPDYQRWTYTGGHGVEGAVVYDDDTRMWSFHGSDPAAGTMANAFDLVRIHHWPEVAAQEEAEQIQMTKRETYRLMDELARRDERVIRELAGSELNELPDEMPNEATHTGEAQSNFEGELRTDKVSKLDVARFRREIADAQIEEEVIAQLNLIAAAKLEPIHVDDLAGIAKQKLNDLGVGVTKASVLDTIKRAGERLRIQAPSDQPDSDVQDSLVDHVLAQHFEGGRTLMKFADVFWRYVGGVWRMENPDLIRQVLDNEIMHIRKNQPRGVKPELLMAVNDIKTSTQSNDLWPLLSRRVTVSEHDDPLDQLKLQMPRVVNCLNGEVHFDDDGLYEFREHDPDHHLTQQVQVIYDPQAEAPVFMGMLKRIFRDQQDPTGVIQHWLALAGYLTQLRRDHKVWMLWYGSGDNGKSTLASVLQSMLGTAAFPVENLAKVDQDTHAMAYMTRALLLIDDDYPAGEALPDAMIKKMSEAKQLMANPKFGGYVRFICRAPILILSNHWPETRDVSDALYARAQVFNFNTKLAVEEQDPSLVDYVIEHELPGVLNLMIEAYARTVCDEGLSPPVDCLLARDAWASNANMILTWMNENVEEDPAAVTESKQLWTDFTLWRDEVMGRYGRGGSGGLTRNGFYKRLEEMGYTRKGLGQNRFGYVGLRLPQDDLPGESE